MSTEPCVESGCRENACVTGGAYCLEHVTDARGKLRAPPAGFDCPDCKMRHIGDPCDKAPPGLTAEDFAHMLDDALRRRVRTFALETTMRGCPVKFSATFEPPERKGKGDDRE